MSMRPRRNHSSAFKTKAALAVVKVLHAKIGALTLANDFLVGALGQRRSVAECKEMIGRAHALPLIAQARQHGIRRGSICYLPRGNARGGNIRPMQLHGHLFRMLAFAERAVGGAETQQTRHGRDGSVVTGMVAADRI